MSIDLKDSGSGLPPLGTNHNSQSLCDIADDDVEVAPIYRCIGKIEKPIRPCRNLDLCIEQEAERPESHCKQPALAKEVPISRSLALKPKSQEHNSSNYLL